MVAGTQLFLTMGVNTIFMVEGYLEPISGLFAVPKNSGSEVIFPVNLYLSGQRMLLEEKE